MKLTYETLDDELTYTLDEASEVTGLSKHYIRALIRKDRLEAIKVPIAEGSRVTRWELDTDVIRSLKTRGNRSIRVDGRNKYYIYMTPEERIELQEIFTVMNKADWLERVTPAYTKKKKKDE